jgi:hypothetical protein
MYPSDLRASITRFAGGLGPPEPVSEVEKKRRESDWGVLEEGRGKPPGIGLKRISVSERGDNVGNHLQEQADIGDGRRRCQEKAAGKQITAIGSPD